MICRKQEALPIYVVLGNLAADSLLGWWILELHFLWGEPQGGTFMSLIGSIVFGMSVVSLISRVQSCQVPCLSVFGFFDVNPVVCTMVLDSPHIVVYIAKTYASSAQKAEAVREILFCQVCVISGFICNNAVGTQMFTGIMYRYL